MDGLNVFRHGRRALNLSMVHKIFPSREPASRCDVVHSHYGPNGVRAVYWREAGILEGPVVTTFHGYDANMLPRKHGSELYQKLFVDGDCFTVGSEFMRKRLISLGAPAERILKVPMGVDVRRYKFDERQKAGGTELRLLSIARLVEVKGLEYVLKALGRMKNALGPFRYTIAGDGPLRGKLESLAREIGLQGEVEFRGAVSREEAVGLYQQADIFVLASVPTEAGEEENQPVVLAEAQAAGLPVIATRIGGIPESMVEHETGLLVPPRDPEALSTAIGSLAERPERRKEMGRAGRQFVESDFNLEKLNDRWVELYRNLIGRNEKRRKEACEA
jgi:colanic acid/amylovoran biosynthesis glycosyltransferase